MGKMEKNALYIKFFLYVIFLYHCVHSCPHSCTCNTSSLSVICNKFSFSFGNLIRNVPTETKVLFLSNGQLLQERVEDFLYPRLENRPKGIPEIEKISIFYTKFTPSLEIQNLNYYLQDVKSISIVHSYLPMLPAGIFKESIKLEVLNISHNGIEYLDEDAFDNLHQLKVLDLSFNNLHILPHNLFEIFKDLESLHINDNQIKYIHPYSIANLTELKNLHLDFNKLVTLHENIIPENGSALKLVQLQGNPWDCNCGLLWLAQLLQANETFEPFPNRESIKCHTPSSLQGIPVYKLTNETLKCDLPAIVNHPPANVTLQRIHSHVLHCNATGKPEPAIYWLTPKGVFAQPKHRKYISPNILKLAQKMNFKGIPTFTESSMEVLPNGSLYFHQVRWYYAGLYACVAENPGGLSMVKVQVKVFAVIKHYVNISYFFGSGAALAFFIISLLVVAIQRLIIKLCCKKAKNVQDIISKEETQEFLSDSKSSSPCEWYLSPDLSREWSQSPHSSPVKCVTPCEDYHDDMVHKNIRETLEDVRVDLQKRVERQKDRIRTRAHRVKTSGSHYMHSIKETGTMKMHNIKESGTQYVRTIRSSGSQAVHNIRASGSQYAHRVRAGVVLGVEQVKYHVQSMKEFCGTGDISHTVSTISISTNVDSNEQRKKKKVPTATLR